MDAILQSHYIEPTALRANDFQQFYEARRESLLTIVERAMGKAVEREAPGDSGADIEEEMQLMEAHA
jgi:hypothetical protein